MKKLAALALSLSSALLIAGCSTIPKISLDQIAELAPLEREIAIPIEENGQLKEVAFYELYIDADGYIHTKYEGYVRDGTFYPAPNYKQPQDQTQAPVPVPQPQNYRPIPSA